MLAAHKPYTADNPMAIIYMHRNAPTPRLPEALIDLQPLLDRLMGKLAQERFENAGDAMRAIDAARAAWLTKGALA